MKIVIFGLSVSSAWGNGHATIWRGLLRSLVERGHVPVFFERDVAYYARSRDLFEIPGGELILYGEWKNILSLAAKYLLRADACVITSYCPDAIAAAELMQEARCVRVFYDLDTPVTLAGDVTYVPANGFRDFDLVLSYTGGGALKKLETELGAKRVAPLYGSADPEVHCPVGGDAAFASDLSYLGTYAMDRQQILEELFFEPARRKPEYRFLLAGSQYPRDLEMGRNVSYIGHVPPGAHASFYCSARLNLNVTRGVMAKSGYCPSGRLFEAAACGAPVLSDWWEGLDQFFEPGKEILIAGTSEEAVERLEGKNLGAIGEAARRRVLAEHTAKHRAMELEKLLG